MGEWEAWIQLGCALMFAITLLKYTLVTLTKRLDKIEQKQDDNERVLLWLYTKHDGPPMVDKGDSDE